MADYMKAGSESPCSSPSLNGDITAKRVKESRKKRKARCKEEAAALTAAGGEGSGDGANGSLHTNRRHSMSKPARDLRDEPERKKARKMKAAAAAAAADVSDNKEIVTRSPSPAVDFDGLSRPSRGTRERLEESPEQAEKRLEKMSGAIKTILECIGEDPDREGLLATPERYAKAMLFFTKGYQQNIADIVNGAIFHEGHNEMVIVKDIDIFSLCEHHLVPFNGKVSLSSSRYRLTPVAHTTLTCHSRCTSATFPKTPSSAYPSYRVLQRCSAGDYKSKSA